MAGIDIDVTEWLGFAGDLAAIDVMPDVRGVVAKGALNIKNQMQDEARGSRHFQIASLINFEQKQTANTAEAEIGPRKVGAGNLANLAYFGGSNGGGGTIADPEIAMLAEEPRFNDALAKVVAQAMGAA